MGGRRRLLVAGAAVVVAAVGIGAVALLPREPERQALLRGDAAAAATGALVNQAPEPAAGADVVDGWILTRLDVAIRADATVDQVNAAVEKVGGTISSMRAGLPMITIAVPRQPGPGALDALARMLESQPGIRAVLPGRDVQGTEAPPPPADAENAFAYLQGSHFPAAWNARRAAQGICANNRVTVIVADKFHRPIDALYAQFAAQVPGVTNDGTGAPDPGDLHGNHGYDVLTTLAGKFDATVPTGANPYPECLDIHALQIDGLSSAAQVHALETALDATSGKVVLNTSFGWDACGVPIQGTYLDCTRENLNAPTAFERASWAAVQRASMQRYADRVLVVSSAGNEADKPVGKAYPGTMQASWGSSLNVAARANATYAFITDAALWNYAFPCVDPVACLPNLTAGPEEVEQLRGQLEDLGSGATTPLTNVLIAGSFDNDYNLSAFSDRGADVLAFGEGVPTLLGVPVGGTSYSAPQVAGLASYLWMVSPDLRGRPVADTISAILDTTDQTNLHAYRAVLSTDTPGPPTPSSAPVRFAILDVNADNAFDLADLQLIRDTYIDSGLMVEPSEWDYGRYDLNGDGFTGGTRGTRFDLDTTGSPRFGAPVLLDATLLIGGSEHTFSEIAVTDPQIACYYASTELFSGGRLDERDAIVNELCPGASGEVLAGTLTFTSHNEVPGVQYDVEYTITVTAEVVEGEIVLTAITGTGSDRYTYDPSGTFNCAPGRPSETKSGTIDDAVGFRIADGEAGQVGISPNASGTEVSSFCDGGSWRTESESDSFQLSDVVGTAVVVDGKTVAIDFNLDVTDEFGEHRVTTGRLTRRACTFADGCGVSGD